MKKTVLLIVILFSFTSIGIAQKNPPSVKTTETKPPPAVTKIPEAEWKTLIEALQSENWQTTAPLAAQYLKKLSTENEKKQMAQLRYFYLYALAGKILAVSSVNIPAETDAMWNELDAAISSFVGKELIAPPRRALSECREVLNYICPVKNSEKALRVTATNKEGTMIHSFDYVTFNEKIPLSEIADQEVFLGGTLKRTEFNQDMSKLWVMRLFFEKGFVQAAANK